MTNDQTSEANGVSARIKTALATVSAVARESDTIHWLTTDAAGRLKARAVERQKSIENMRERGGGNLTQEQIKDILRFATAEARAQQRLAEWLMSLAGKPGGES